ncbi:3849_t:CDS:2 [Dentiscutata erythropus]|uniref:3849_t:CDS:1 n=1 Tax=Dentiscutata erythropus TaxID=1348616 RepID=A0A9N9FBX0_9GLOM|nr:3849_t:CDS:2 [Dentiscutata erythropus]
MGSLIVILASSVSIDDFIVDCLIVGSSSVVSVALLLVPLVKVIQENIHVIKFEFIEEALHAVYEDL